MRRTWPLLLWAALVTAIAIPFALAAMSPLLQWRSPVYIAAGFFGIAAMAMLLLQPLLIGGTLPGLGGLKGRRLHRIVGVALVVAVIAHVGGLWIESPPDVVDVLLFRSPTPFSEWGAIALWSVFAAALLAAFRKRLKLRPPGWRLAHFAFAGVAVLCTVLHALLIEGTMETVSKAALSILVVAAAVKLAIDLRIWSFRPPRQARQQPRGQPPRPPGGHPRDRSPSPEEAG